MDEVGYAVYRDPVYLALLNATHVQRGVQVVGETSALGREAEPVTPFALVPELPGTGTAFTPHSSVNCRGERICDPAQRRPQNVIRAP